MYRVIRILAMLYFQLLVSDLSRHLEVHIKSHACLVPILASTS